MNAIKKMETLGMPRVLLCSQNESMGLKVMYCLHAGGYDVDVLSLASRNATRHSRYGDKFEFLGSERDQRDAQEHAIDWINRRASQRRWAAVLADDVYSHGFLHAIRDHLSIPTFAPSPRGLLDEMHDKWSFYSKMKTSGIPVPLSSLVTSPEGLTEREADAIGFPLLIKPLNEESGHGIQRFAGLPYAGAVPAYPRPVPRISPKDPALRQGPYDRAVSARAKW